MRFPRLVPRLAIVVAFASSFLFALLDGAVAEGGRSTSTSPSPASQTELPPPSLVELGLSYDFIRLAGAAEVDYLHGASASAFVNVASWFAVGGEFTAGFGSGGPQFGSGDLTDDRYLYLFGPRLSVWPNPRIRIFGQVLTGAVHAELEVTNGFYNQGVTANAFAMSAGGGVDWRFTDQFYWRVLQADYLRMHFTGQQDNWRLSTGIVFAFGGKK